MSDRTHFITAVGVTVALTVFTIRIIRDKGQS